MFGTRIALQGVFNLSKTKFMRRLSLFAVALIMATLLYAVPRLEGEGGDKLPKAASEFIHKYLASTEISRVDIDNKSTKEQYVVYFKNGDKATFDASSGKCTSLDMSVGAVPDAVVPGKVLDYVKRHYPSSYIVSICHIEGGGRIVLNSGKSICIDRDGNIIADAKCDDKSKDRCDTDSKR